MNCGRRAFVALVIVASLTACGTPQVVKSLSAEQAKAMEGFGGDLKGYFAVVEELVNNQIKQAGDQLDELNDDVVVLQRRKAALGLQKAGKVDAQSPALVGFSDELKAQLTLTNTLKGELAQRRNSLAAAHVRLLTAYSTLVEAEKRLDQYLQLEKADERVLSELLGSIGVSRNQFGAAVDTVSTVARGVNETIAKIGQLKKAA